MASRKSQIEMAIYDWVQAALSEQHPGTPIVYEDDGQPNPGKQGLPYVSIQLISRRRQGTPATGVIDNGGTITTRIVSRYEGRVRLTVIGSSDTVSAWEVSERLEDSISDPRVQVVLSGAETDTTPRRTAWASPVERLSDATEVTALLSTGSETRIQQDFLWSGAVCRESTEPVDCIESAVVTGTIGDVTINTTAP